MITVLIWKMACIDIFITYFNIELKRTKLISHTDTKLMDMWCHGAHERLDILLSEFCPDIFTWADIAVALRVFTYRQS
jgi:hypothetical protein